MKANTQILTPALFRKIGAGYERALVYYQENNIDKEDNLQNFSQYVKMSLERYNIVWDNNDFSALYSLHLTYKDALNVDFNNADEVFSCYYNYLKSSQEAGFDVVDNSNSFNDFVKHTTSANKISNDTSKALFSLYKLSRTSRSILPSEREALMNSITDKKNNLKLRKMHSVRDFIIKKGGVLTTIAIGVFAGFAIATAALPAGGLVAASALNNALTFGTWGATAGGILAYAGIKLKNTITKRYYKKKYNLSEKDILELEDGIISVDQLRINKLIEKTHKTNLKISKLSKDLEPKTGFGKVTNTFKKFGRGIKKHALNIVNRNRIHTISDELNIINKRIDATIKSDLMPNEIAARVNALSQVRNKIATVRAHELIDNMASSLSSSKLKSIENLDIYAKDLIQDKNQRKNKKLVRRKAKEILDNILIGDATLLAGNCMLDETIPVQERHIALLPEAQTIQPMVANDIVEINHTTETEVQPEVEVTVEEQIENAVNETIEQIEISETEAVTPVEEVVEITPIQPEQRIIKTLISVKDKDIAVESTMLALLKNPNIVTDLIRNGYDQEVIAKLSAELANRQNPGVDRNGKIRPKKRIRTTKFYKETEGVEDLYAALTVYNTEKAHAVNRYVHHDEHAPASPNYYGPDDMIYE